MKGFFSKTDFSHVKAPASLIPRCGACQLYLHCDSPKMPVSGKGKRKILICGEGPGANEDEQGIQFIGESGQLLERTLAKFDVDMRRDCWITNSIICRSHTKDDKNRTPTPKEIDYCRPNLIKTITELKPDVIIPLGGSAVKSLLGWLWKEDVGPISRWDGWAIPSQKINAWVCHPAGTLITTQRGLAPIEEVIVGDFALTHMGSWEPVTETFQRKFSGRLFGVKRACFSEPLEATPEHPLLVSKQGGRFEWTNVKNIIPGDYLVEPLPVNQTKIADGKIIWRYTRPPGRWKNGKGKKALGKHEVRATLETMKLLGYYLAEGSSLGRSGVSFAFHTSEVDFIEEVKSSFNSVFVSGNKVSLRTRGNTVEVLCHGAVAGSFLGTTGSSSLNKKFPNWVWGCSDGLLKEMLRCLWNGDGWKIGNGFGLQSSSRQLIEDVRRLLLRLGVVSWVRKRSRKGKRVEIAGNVSTANDAWELTVRGSWASKLATFLKISFPLIKHLRKADAFIDGGYVWYLVRKCAPIRKVVNSYVFNIEVENDHSYLAEGIVSHNCPTWHPAYILRSDYGVSQKQNDVRQLFFEKHLKAACKLEGKPWKVVPDWTSKIEIIIDPDKAADKISDMRESSACVAFDYETMTLKPDSDKAEIVCCSISNGERTIAYPWHGRAIKETGNLLFSDVKKIASNMKFEERWTIKEFGRGVKNWAIDTMLASHVIDNRPLITSIKFQAFVLLGVDSWDGHIKPYLKSKNNNTPNRIREVGLTSLLKYCALDSLYEYKVAEIQAKKIGVEI